MNVHGCFPVLRILHLSALVSEKGPSQQPKFQFRPQRAYNTARSHFMHHRVIPPRFLESINQVAHRLIERIVNRLPHCIRQGPPEGSSKMFSSTAHLSPQRIGPATSQIDLPFYSLCESLMASHLSYTIRPFPSGVELLWKRPTTSEPPKLSS